MVTVFVLARMLGSDGYGQFVAILATASFLTPFAGLGLSNIVLRNGAKDPAGLDRYQGRAMRAWKLSLMPVIVVACMLAVLLLPSEIPRGLAFMAIAGELAATSLVDLRARYQQAGSRIVAFGAINAGLPMVRLAALLLLLILAGDHSMQRALVVYTVASLVYVIVLGFPYRRRLRCQSVTEPMTIADGLPFSMAGFAVRLQAEFNKPVLAHLGFDLVGTYNAAQRTGDLASMPLSALQESLWPRLYASSTTMRELAVAAVMLVLLAIGCAICIWMVAPLLPYVLGSEFSGAVSTARCLAFLPLLQAIRSLLNFQVIRQNATGLIGWACAVGALVGVLGVMLLVPDRGIMGAVVSTYASEVAMLIVLVVGVVRLEWHAA